MWRYPEKSNKQNNRSTALIHPYIYHLLNAAFIEISQNNISFATIKQEKVQCSILGDQVSGNIFRMEA